MSSQPGSVRTPLESVFSYIPASHEKVAKQALFNVAALAFVLVFLAVAVATYNVFQPFARPLLWALLLGTVMYPVKRRMTEAARGWLAGLQRSSTPLLVHMLLAPAWAFDAATDAIGNAAVRHLTALLALVGTLAVVNVVWFYTPSLATGLLWLLSDGLVGNLLWLLTSIFYNKLLCWSLLLGYLVAVVFFWSSLTRRFTVPCWLLLLGFLSGLAGPLAGPIFVALVALMVVGFITEVLDRRRECQHEGINESMSKTIQAIMWNQSTVLQQSQSSPAGLSGSHDASAGDAPTTEDSSSASLPSSIAQSPTDDPQTTPAAEAESRPSARSAAHLSQKGEPALPMQGSSADTISSEGTGLTKKPAQRQAMGDAAGETGASAGVSQTRRYITGVAYCCLTVVIWQRIWLISMLPVVLVYYFCKRLALNFWESGGRDAAYASLRTVHEWMTERQEGIMPLPVRGMWKLILRGNGRVVTAVYGSVDTVVTAVVLLAALVIVTFTTVFAAVQIYGEAVHMVELAANVINSTVVANPDLQSLLPANISQVMEQVIDNGYIYGRDYISKLVRDLTPGTSVQAQAQLERQTLELWERLYQAWVTSVVAVPPVGPVVDAAGVASAAQLWLQRVQNSTDLFAVDMIKAAVQSNLSTILSVLESSWVILRGNLSMLATLVTTLTSVLLGSGFAVLNTVLNLIVFVTALFYLLSASDKAYKPVELISRMGPVSRGSSRFVIAVDEAVSGVFFASFKMATFYFMWTWLVHSLFNVKFVYLPSVVAALLGAVPFLGSYWAALPALLELWLVHAQPLTALLFFTAQLAPILCVDTAIYSEVKGGHPYLTGLAIAGGIFCQGIEGAIFGPVLLCCLLVAVNMYSSLVNSPDEERRTFIGRLKRMGSVW